MNIVLFGFMATGKTSVGKVIAEKLGMNYVSTDDKIVLKEKKPIKEIFEKDKEPYFRAVEKDIVKKLSSEDNLVIDTGGGVVIDKENITNLGKNGVLILLCADEDSILKRVENDTSRPLLNVSDRALKIKELLQKRKPFYSQISIKINTSGKTIEEVADEVIKIYKRPKGKG